LVIAGWPLVNMPLGALAKISGIVNLEDLEAIAIEQFGRRGELNTKAIELGANGVRKLD